MEKVTLDWDRLNVMVIDRKSKSLPISIVIKCKIDGEDVMLGIPIGKGNAKYLRKQIKKALKYLD